MTSIIVKVSKEDCLYQLTCSFLNQKKKLIDGEDIRKVRFPEAELSWKVLSNAVNFIFECPTSLSYVNKLGIRKTISSDVQLKMILNQREGDVIRLEVAKLVNNSNNSNVQPNNSAKSNSNSPQQSQKCDNCNCEKEEEKKGGKFSNARRVMNAMNMPKLSKDHSRIQAHYDCVVIGSGYGGSIAASRMSRLGKKVCLLERGKEYSPGEFPNTLEKSIPQFRITLPDGSVLGSLTGFFDFTISKNCLVWRGNGLGGGSLVNSNVSIRPELRVFESWPPEILQDVDLLEEMYHQAELVLCPNQYPNSATEPIQKCETLRAASAATDGRFYEASVNVTFSNRVNDQGVYQPACTLCGDCNSGCNYGSKNTMYMNYLPDALQHGAEIYCHCEVTYIAQNGTGWEVFFNILPDHAAPIPMSITCDTLMLGAGTLGSTEILLRSASMGGLQLSPMLGQKFGADGDFFGISYNTTEHCNDIGYGPNPPKQMYKREGRVGPCIMSVLDMRKDTIPLEDCFIVEDMAIPGAFSGFVNLALPLVSAIWGTNTDPTDKTDQRIRMIESIFAGPYKGATRNSLLLGGMAYDSQDGEMLLDDNRLVINWPDAVNSDRFAMQNQLLQTLTTQMQGIFLEDPLGLFDVEPIVHPLGGCIIGTAADTGVVNHAGQVYMGSSGTSVYSGLYVCDGSIVPTALMVNPLFTISALAERICYLIAQGEGNTIPYGPTHLTATHPFDW